MATQTVLGREHPENDNLARVMARAAEAWALRLNTSMPGEIIRYDAATRRADVQPSIQVMTVDGTLIDAPEVLDVPVVFQMCSIFAMTYLPQPGDSVLLVFSQRGLAHWKETHGKSPPTHESLLSVQDAMCIPGFGPRGVHEPDIRIVATEDELTVQRADAERVRFHAGGITIESAGEITITGGDVIITGTTTVNGQQVAQVAAGTTTVGAHSHGLTAA